MQKRNRIAAAGITAAAVTLLGGLGSLPNAVAHTSAFTGHYTLSGDYWQLVYKGPLDQYASSCGGTGHFHDVNHNYRSVPNQGPYNFYHQQFHFVGCGGAARPAGDFSAEPLPAPQPSPDELATARDAAEAKRTLCSKYDLFCDGDTEADAPATVKRMRGGYLVRVLTLTGTPVFGGDRYVAAEARRPPAGTCVIGLLDPLGHGPAQAAELAQGFTVEVVTPETAERLGHPC